MAVRGINKVILVGRLGKDPEVRYIPNGGAVANLQVATSETWRDKQTGEMREQTEWHRVVLFGKLAEVAGEYLRKGAQVYIEGQLRTRSWEDNGITRYVTEILVKTTGTMQMLGRAAGAQTQPEEGQQFSAQPQPEPQSEVANDMDDEMLMHGSLPAANPLDTSLFTTNAGRFSVSRINIAIGQVSIVVWCLAYLIQSICFSFSNQLLFILNDCGTFPWVSILSLLVWLLLLVLIIVIVKYTQWCRSSGI